MLLRDIYDMKHIQLYEAFNEAPLPPGVEEISYDDYYNKNGMHRISQSVAFTKDETQNLETLCQLARLTKGPYNKEKEFQMARRAGVRNWAPPGAFFGRKADGKYYLRTYPNFPEQAKYYVSQSLEDLLPIAMYGIELQFPGWIKIR